MSGASFPKRHPSASWRPSSASLVFLWLKHPHGHNFKMDTNKPLYSWSCEALVAVFHWPSKPDHKVPMSMLFWALQHSAKASCKGDAAISGGG
eukprot:4936839-Alexandrium_andersonii.AAC.1